MVMAQSLLIRLKQNDPECEVAVLAPEWTRALLDHMPEVNYSIAAQTDHGELHLLKRRRLGKELIEKQFDRAIVLPNSFKSALLPFFAKIPKRIGWRGEWRNLLLSDCRILRAKAMPLMVQRYAALAGPANASSEQFPRPNLHTDPAVTARAMEKFSLDKSGKILAICPGAEFGAAKQWPSRHYAVLCKSYIDNGGQVWIFGSAKDSGIASEIQLELMSPQSSSCIDLTGKTTLGEAIDLMSEVDSVVSNDSGLMHIAAALGKPVTGIYGSTSPEFTPPLTEKVKLLSTDIDCRPCFKRECPYGHLKCLEDLDPIRVIGAVNELEGNSLTKE